MGYIGNTPGSLPITLGEIPTIPVVAPGIGVSLNEAGHMLLCNASAGNISVALPLIGSVPPGFTIHVKKVDASVNTVTLDGAGGETINSALTVIISDLNDGISITAGPTAWFSFSASGAGAGSGGGGGGSITIQEDATPLTPRSVINFIGSAVTAVDNPGQNRTDVTVTTGAGLSVQDEGSVLTARNILNFIGAGVTAVDNPGQSRTDITVSGGGGGGLSSAGGSDSMPHAEFDIGINNSASLTLTTSALTNSYQYLGAGSAIIHGVLATNIDGTNEVLVDMIHHDFTAATDFYLAKLIPIPANTSLDLIKRAKVLKTNDRLKFKTDIANGVQLAIRYTEFNANTDLDHTMYVASVVGPVTIYTESNALGSVVESILLVNSDGTNSVAVTIQINDGSANPKLTSTMNIPAGATVEVCEVPMVLKNTNTVSLTVSDTNRLTCAVTKRSI